MTAIECGKIYKITSPTGRVYIGQTILPIEKRWDAYRTLKCKSQTKLYRSFKKHGVENHIFEVVMSGITTKEMLDWYEMFYINVYDSYKNGLNSTLGGDGYLIPEEKLKYGIRSGDKNYMHVLYEENKEERLIRGKVYREAHKEQIKVYNDAHKEEQKAKRKARHKAHKEEDKAYSKKWREANPDYAKVHHEKEKAIRAYFGYSERRWKSLPSDMRAQMRAKYEEETKQTTLF